MWLKLNDNSSESIIVKQRHGNNAYSRLSIGIKPPQVVDNQLEHLGKSIFTAKLFNSWF